ncbi:prohibitin-3, mitochondrial-like [Iris pallida]|uniref:Prohibitin-3, mitochondrial-like n=1 Tax=Iris pallida TaxID=29817 RepID=A0AAX6F0Q6_IRIPA|nr:prohibitin-3, mitochondrial-like [Iris pallida]
MASSSPTPSRRSRSPSRRPSAPSSSSPRPSRRRGSPSSVLRERARPRALSPRPPPPSGPGSSSSGGSRPRGRSSRRSRGRPTSCTSCARTICCTGYPGAAAGKILLRPLSLCSSLYDGLVSVIINNLLLLCYMVSFGLRLSW